MTRKSVAYGFRRREIVIQSSEQAMYIKTGRQDRKEMMGHQRRFYAQRGIAYGKNSRTQAAVQQIQ